MSSKYVIITAANHYLASAKAANNFYKFGDPTDMMQTMKEFRKGDVAMQALGSGDQETIDSLNLLRDAAAKGDFNLARARHTTLTS